MARHTESGVLDDVPCTIWGKRITAELGFSCIRRPRRWVLTAIKLKDSEVGDTDYKRILEIFQKYDVRYFFYNGRNDSMDTCNKISKYMQKAGYECRIMGVPEDD